jgi:hypothetical protein
MAGINPTPIAFARMRWLLHGLRFAEHATEKSLVFCRSKNTRIVFRRYGDDETLEWRDIASVRKLVRKRRMWREDCFDAFLGLSIRRSRITFAQLRCFLEPIGYRHHRIEKGEVMVQRKKRMLIYPRYFDQEFVSLRDLASTRRFLDDWGQLDAADFDAFLESTTKPA